MAIKRDRERDPAPALHALFHLRFHGSTCTSHMHQPRRSSQSIHSQFTRRRMWTTHLFSVAPPSSNSCFSISPIIGFLTKADQGDIAEETHTKRWVNRNRMWMWQASERQKGSRFNIKHTYIVCIYWMHHVMANDGFRTGCRRCRHHARKQEPK